MKTKTQTMTITKWGVLAFAASVLACELPIDQLEVGDAMDGADEDTGTDSSGDAGDSDGDGDGDDGDASLECVEQGTNLAGGDEPIDFPLPECEVVCASGFGHDVAPLASEWTLDLEHTGPSTGFTYLEATATGELLVLLGHHDEAARLYWISPEGELLDELTQPAIHGDVWGIAITDEGIIFVLWRDETNQSLTALSSSGEHLWTIKLGLDVGQSSALAVLGSGVVVALDSTMLPDDGELMHVDSSGEVVGLGSIPPTDKIAVSPSGNTIVVANSTTISWMDLELFPNGSSTQGVADVSLVFGLVALDDERVVSVGVANNWEEDSSLHGYVNQVGPMGLEWEGRYDRASSWCPEESDDEVTHEHIYNVEQLADGTLLVVGAESGGFGNGLDRGQLPSEQIMQPWVAHVSAQGEVLATDRGFWRGLGAAVASTQDAAYVLLFEYRDAQQHLYVRKYLP
jgi:hypothetical protein